MNRRFNGGLWEAATLVVGLMLASCTGDSVVGDRTGMDAGADIACTGAATRCGTTCVDTRSDTANCGACGNACGASMLCTNGTCQLSCPGGATACSGTCVNVQTDNANCGRCGQACAGGQVCSLGRCSLTCASTLATCGGGDAGADAGSTQRCADLTTDNNNCGACGTVCPSGQRCLDRHCQVSCAVGQTTCNGTCRDLQTDNNNCGACGNACLAGTTCTAGVCAVSCSAALTQCGSTCVNLQTDNDNCGNCGLACASGQVCSRGTCATSCATSLATCPSTDGAYCANTAVDPANCGMCGRACSLPHTTTAGCTAGSCSVVRCATGFGDCDGDPSNGCESSTTDNVSNCGACGRACVLPHASAMCAASTCAIGACAPGFADCDGVAANGCEVNTQADNGNCGTCGTSCPAGQVCSGGTCGTTCAAPLTACTGSASAYCANTQNDPTNCGACGRGCALAHTAVTTCASGGCAVASCSMGFADCDHDATTGCEASLLTDTANCGACGRLCVLANAASTCSSGACAVTTCNAGYADCNAMAADGCEVNTQTDNANCGACGTTCGAGQVCSGGMCRTTCASPLATCGTGSAQFCANTSIDPSNCGACGTACALPNVAANGCASGACTVHVCNASFGDCDGTAANGCESNLQADEANCGTCGHLCALPNAASTCMGGSCALGACSVGFANCDGSGANGCEVNTNTDNGNCGACGTSCPAGQVCSSGHCTTTCASPLATCGTGSAQYCAATASDPANCGSCGTTCALAHASNSGCNAGGCVVIGCLTGFANCNAAASDGCEANLNTDIANCGACGRACVGTQTCVGGTCTCGAGRTLCGSTCVNTATDSSNCGVCGHACALSNATSACTASACAITACGTGFANCDSDPTNGCEINTQTDSGNCGGCGVTCGAGQVCSRGACTTTCAAPLSTCGTAPAQYCANVSVDPANCGSCGNVCTLAHATEGCGGGACTVQRCDAGFGDCDNVASTGCEANLNTSAANCGACGRACALANATSACTSGACTVSACSTGYLDCDGIAADGCEVNTRTDLNNCGACGVSCSAGQVCSAGVCTATCASPLSTCGAASSAYCANLSSDPLNCGVCSLVCALSGAATNGCSGGACTVLTCNAGLGNCDAIAANGCETNLNTTAANCGACGRACSLSFATATCVGGACAVGSCTTGHRDCDASPSNGCEVNILTDNANCGGCGTPCGAGQVCSSGVCTATCASPLTACSGACVNLATDPTHCGLCTTTCPARTNAAPVCNSSVCGYVCSAGFADCDLASANGCEVNVTTSLTNCGACGNACPARANATATCGSGTCGFTCNSGFADCDGVASNGCEVDLSSNAAHCGTCATSCGTGACTAGSCGPACYTGAARVLMLSSGGSASTTYFPAGTVVTTVTDAMWSSMTAAQFGNYDLLWVDGGACTGTLTPYATLTSTVAAWGPAVTGRVALTTSDADHHAPGNGNARTFIANSVRYLAGLGRNVDGGRTGMYLSTGCSGVTLGNYTGAFGSPLTSSTGVSCVDPTAVTTAGLTHPMLSGIATTSALSWGCFGHTYMSAYPAAFTDLADLGTGQAGLVVRSVTCH